MNTSLGQVAERITSLRPDHAPYSQFIVDEQTAASELFYCNSVLPGPLQQSDVARAILRAYRPEDSAEATEVYVQARQQRAAEMARTALKSEYFIDQRVLDAQPPGCDWQAQLERLVETDGQPSQRLRIIPRGNFYIAQDMTTLLTQPDGRQNVCLETSFDTVEYTDDPQKVATAAAMFQRLDALALSHDQSIDVIVHDYIQSA